MIRKVAVFLLLFVRISSAISETISTQQAQDHGFNTCLKSVDTIAKFLTGENKNGAVSTWNSKNTDGRLFNSQIVIQYSDGHSMAVINVAPTKSGKCDGSYTRVFTTAKSCQVARETIYKDWKFYGEIGGLVSLENTKGNVSAILQPHESGGCVAMLTEVVYE